MSTHAPHKCMPIQTLCIPEFLRLGLAIKSVLSEQFLTSDLADPSTTCTGYCTQGMSLEDVIIMRHCSHGDEDRNRDPNVEEILEHSTDGMGTTELASSTCGYTKTGQLKQEFCNYQDAATGSNKKPRVHSMEKADHSALSPCQDSHLPQLVPSAVSNGLVSKSMIFITPGMDSITTPPPPLLRGVQHVSLTVHHWSHHLNMPVSTIGWQGTNYASSEEGRVLRKEWYEYSILFCLTEFERVPYQRGCSNVLRAAPLRFQPSEFLFLQKPSLSAWHLTNHKAIDQLWTLAGAMSQIRKNSPFLQEDTEHVSASYSYTFMCTNGALPTEENSSCLDGGDGRGSCVWFNQATMFQSAELGFATVADAQKAGAPCTSDASLLIHQGHLPAL
ncbi:hypothetical protein DEU56DRAFT_755527 [Suillus clintonianus]|uniref:uncharacterized protein n=1 Tax=Suillus clintonianus TaxID=1904413 RepID=UPI001B879A77|nr:uncharacterized protein DEU56DRAFT_755527 [Suillus clintonianus]KAG2139779.1 hypothetical protein DEU56DRAFT_755527 [Suillus clintonianus]